jgi:hypothetical protein
MTKQYLVEISWKEMEWESNTTAELDSSLLSAQYMYTSISSTGSALHELTAPSCPSSVRIARGMVVRKFREFEPKLRPAGLFINAFRKIGCTLDADKRRISIFDFDQDEEGDDADTTINSADQDQTVQSHESTQMFVDE